MKSKKVLVHASQALCAMIVLSFLAAGCGKEEKAASLPEVYPVEGNAYMSDPAFKAALAEQEREQRAILGAGEATFVALQEIEKRAGSRAAAEKTPEWKELEAKAKAHEAALEANRMQTTQMFRERLKRAREDSERIARGEARAKKTEEISK